MARAVDIEAKKALSQVQFPLGPRLKAGSILFLRSLLRKHGLAENSRKNAVAKLSGPPIPHEDVDPKMFVEVPRIKREDLTPEVMAEAVKLSIPIVLEGAALDCEAVRKWTPEYLRDEYGDVMIPMWAEHSDIPDMPLRECMRHIIEEDGDRQIQINNVCSLLSQRGELLDELDLDSYRKAIKSIRYHGSNIFVCRGDNGSKYHCANEVNLFFQVYGRKEWFFVHPRYTSAMDPLFTMPKGNYFASGVNWGEQPNNVPIGRTMLNPGDVLINPPWWWHWVKNETTTIGIATRWLAWKHRFGTDNPLFSGLQWLFPHQWKIMWQDYLHGQPLDEHKWVHADRDPEVPKSDKLSTH